MPERLGGPRDPDRKVVSLSGAAAAARAARRAGRKVVLANGVFDLLHAGHARLLAAARRLGDLLIVAVNTDASVRRLKGPGRPVVGHRDRALLLASLEAVDRVVLFGEDTPIRVIRAVLPDVLVKGADWKSGAIVGQDVVESRGGRVVRVPIVKGKSTTSIVRGILHRPRR
ncbi:MAG TPA: D-glycero-beta-D-manno-heptose 1-phosphate adenylyltransferase [Candidatus Polarisedimenticolia bacterium]|nr:D-glycero-beta-D-manno-heptose 1-phosphate adenylyltransferase [Candidatus Polarisedimenticolia bacterium]